MIGENITNTSFSKFGSSPPFTNFNENLLSNLFHKFAEIRACGCQRTTDVVFWLKLVSVLGFKNSFRVDKQRHNCM